MAIDPALAAALHLHLYERGELAHLAEHDTAVQASTLSALMDGKFDGDLSVAELLEHGDLGIGTFNALDGEMIVLDGVCMRADVNGDVAQVAGATKTPFAVIAPFSAKVSGHVELDFQALLARLDAELPAGAASAAIRIDGKFTDLKLRSVPRQHEPYPTLAEAAAQQQVFELSHESGTVLGFRFPDQSNSLEVPGYHLHFVDDDRKRGGHVLSIGAISGEFHLDPLERLHVELPPGVNPNSENSEIDSDAVRRIESS